MSHTPTTSTELERINKQLSFNNLLNGVMIGLAVVACLFYLIKLAEIKKPEAETSGLYIISNVA